MAKKKKKKVKTSSVFSLASNLKIGIKRG